MRYQVVARLLYRDALREHLDGVFGFTVNLAWVRANYFPEVTRQVARIEASGASLPLAVLDASGAQVAGAPGAAAARLAPGVPAVLLRPSAGAARSCRRPAARGVGRGRGVPARTRRSADAVRGGNRTLFVAGAAAVVFALGLAMTARAIRARTRLADLRSEFVSTVTHELKTPIAAIRAAGDTMARGRLSSPDALRDYAHLVVAQSKRLTRLVDNLLAYARITDVTEAYHFAPLDPGALLDDVVEGFRTTLRDAGFDVAVEVEPGTPAIRGDHAACVLLLDNLVDNAIRYSPAEKWLRLRARAVGPAVTIAVADRGMGIPQDELAHVTRRFVRGRGAGSGGSGLGLAIAARIAADHGGTLAIESTVDVGTTVRVTLPAAEGKP